MDLFYLKDILSKSKVENEISKLLRLNMRLRFAEPIKGQSRCDAFTLVVKSRACLSNQVMHSARRKKSHFL